MCLTDCAALGQQVPRFILHVMDSLCTGYVAAVCLVLLGVAHPAQKQTSGHTGRCDGLGKERKRLGLSVTWPWAHSHLFSAVFMKKDTVMSWRKSRLHQQNSRHQPQSEQNKLQNSDFLSNHLSKNVAKSKN